MTLVVLFLSNQINEASRDSAAYKMTTCTLGIVQVYFEVRGVVGFYQPAL